MSQLQVTGEAKIRDIQGPVVANDGVITALDGLPSQYVRGDGTLADIPTVTGGGSSVSYYLNGSVNQGTFGGSTYYQMSKNAITGVGTNFSASTNGLIAQFITDAGDPDLSSIPSGNWNIEFFMNVSASSGSLASFYVEFYKYDGSTFTLIATNSATPEQLTNTTTIDAYYTSVAFAETPLAVTDRLAIRIYVNVASKTVNLYTEDNRLCQIVTTFSKGILSMNSLTDQEQYLTTGTSGTNFAIVSSGDTHTFNLPVASATNTGKLSSTDWSTFNNKVPYTGATGNVDLGSNDLIAYAVNANILEASLYGTASSPLILKTGTSGFVSGLEAISLISSPSSANTLSIISNVSSVNKTAEIGLGSLSATRTYTLPDASGTLALTSDLSDYVPYTGATSSVDLGTNTLTALGVLANSFSAIGNSNPSGNGGYIFLKQGIGPFTYDIGYNSITANSTRFLLLANVDASNNKSALLELGSLTNNTSRTFTLPDISGTLALLEGSQTFSGVKKFDSGLLLKEGIFTSADGYTAICGEADGLNIITRVGASAYNNSVLFTNATSNTFTFPNASGTIALLENPQTFQSVNTFNGLINSEVSIRLKNNSVTGGSGYIGLGGNSSGITLAIFNAGNIYNQVLTLPNNAAYTYTFPSASGTLALTSNLSSYVPYTGATSTVNLGTNVIYFNSAFVEGNGSTYGGAIAIKQYTSSIVTGSGYTCLFASPSTLGMTFGTSNSAFFDGSALTSNRTYTLPNSTGTIALTSNLSSYLPLAGGTLTGTLNGTSAEFTGNLAGNYLIGNNGGLINTGTNPFVYFNNGGGTNAKRMGLSMTNGDVFKIYSLNDNSTIRTDNIITATINGNVGIGVSPSIWSVGKSLEIGSLGSSLWSYGANNTYLIANAYFNGGWYYANTTVASLFQQDGGAFAWKLAASGTAGTAITWNQAMTLASTGNLLLGTPSDNGQLLQVNGTAALGGYSLSGDFGSDYSIRTGIGISGKGINIGWNTSADCGFIGAVHNGTSWKNLALQPVSGNVGIGVISPTYKLQVSGNTYLLGASSGSGDFALVVQNSSSTNMLLVRNDGAIYTGTASVSPYNLTTGNAANVFVDSGGILYRSTSSLKYKTDVRNYDKGLAEVLQMNPVYYKAKNDDKQFAGLIAEEVHELGLTEFVQYADDGTPDALSYSNMVSLLVKAIQEQQAQIEELKQLINNK